MFPSDYEFIALSNTLTGRGRCGWCDGAAAVLLLRWRCLPAAAAHREEHEEQEEDAHAIQIQVEALGGVGEGGDLVSGLATNHIMITRVSART